jgi:hypothetical protein
LQQGGKGEVLGDDREGFAMMKQIFAGLLLFVSLPMAATGQIVGGWSIIAKPDANADVRAATTAMLGQLPVKKAKLRRIETAEQQVVAGMNYRIRLRLTNGSRWTAVVWCKLDGGYQVSEIARVK